MSTTIEERSVPVMTSAHPGWTAVFWEPCATEPTEAKFCPVIAWGLMEQVERDDDGDVVDRSHWPIAYIVDDGQLCAVGDHDRFLLGFSWPGDETHWATLAVDAWHRWRDERAQKKEGEG